MEQIKKICQQCKRVYKIGSQWAYTSKFCSNECKLARDRDTQKHKHGKLIEKICIVCGGKYKVRQSVGKVQKYCSQKCFGVANIGKRTGEDNHKWKPKVEIKCEYCGKLFYTYPSRLGRKKYCCKSHALIANVKRLVRDKRTDIEIKMAASLNSHKIYFIEQVVMFDKFQVDFLLDKNIIVQCDGEYWHNRPDVKRRDKGQDAYFAKCGYRVLRFTDKQILHNIDECIATIKLWLRKNRFSLP